ncbi:MAG TPA: hypothetical protein VGY48_15665 [Vicinamibacterales bacterium]|jgi:hypothetical protein|nr:hypothetical protein [Vicinamibacterales bacterium]
MPSWFLVARNGQEMRSSRAYSTADLRAFKSTASCHTFINELTNSVKNVGLTCTAKGRKRMGLGFSLKNLFKKKPAPRHPMTRTVYYARTASGTYKPVDRPPSHAMAGARRRRKRRR